MPAGAQSDVLKLKQDKEKTEKQQKQSEETPLTSVYILFHIKFTKFLKQQIIHVNNSYLLNWFSHFSPTAAVFIDWILNVVSLTSLKNTNVNTRVGGPVKTNIMNKQTHTHMTAVNTHPVPSRCQCYIMTVWCNTRTQARTHTRACTHTHMEISGSLDTVWAVLLNQTGSNLWCKFCLK